MRVAIVGATGAVGHELLRVLEKSTLNFDELQLYASPRSAGRTLTFAGRELPVRATPEGAIDADVILKATNVDGVYSADPKRDPTAQRFTQISYTEALNRNLRVMDAAAISLCRDNGLPIVVYNLHVPQNTKRVILGEEIGTLVGGE